MKTIAHSAREMLESCACGRVRTAARLVTRTYDEILRPVGLQASQLGVLAAVGCGDATSIAALSKALSMDRTTLSRNLKPLVAQRLVTVAESGSGRSKTARITQAGEAKLKAALPLWRKAQVALAERAGSRHVAALDQHLLHLIAAY